MVDIANPLRQGLVEKNSKDGQRWKWRQCFLTEKHLVYHRIGGGGGGEKKQKHIPLSECLRVDLIDSNTSEPGIHAMLYTDNRNLDVSRATSNVTNAAGAATSIAGAPTSVGGSSGSSSNPNRSKDTNRSSDGIRSPVDDGKNGINHDSNANSHDKNGKTPPPTDDSGNIPSSSSNSVPKSVANVLPLPSVGMTQGLVQGVSSFFRRTLENVQNTNPSDTGPVPDGSTGGSLFNAVLSGLGPAEPTTSGTSSSLFFIHTKKRTYILRCRNTQDRDGWLLGVAKQAALVKELELLIQAELVIADLELNRSNKREKRFLDATSSYLGCIKFSSECRELFLDFCSDRLEMIHLAQQKSDLCNESDELVRDVSRSRLRKYVEKLASKGRSTVLTVEEDRIDRWLPGVFPIFRSERPFQKRFECLILNSPNY